MSVEVAIVNRQRGRRVDSGLLRRVGVWLLREELGLAEAQLGVRLISARAMAVENWRWLGHEGSTDILTFDHREAGRGPMYGELVISVDDAIRQAGMFGVAPASELVRYVVHGVLHLLGYDDRNAEDRRRMKVREGSLLRRVEGRFELGGLFPGGAGGGVARVVGGRRPRRRGIRSRE